MIFTEKKDMTEKRMQLYLIHHLLRKGFCLCAPNISLRFGEADLLGVRNSGYAEEFEIKISRSDYLADSRKVIKHTYYQNKSMLEKSGFKQFTPNRFSYVLLSGVNPDPIPDYAGCYIVFNSGTVDCIKRPPLLNEFKSAWEKKISAKLMWKYINSLT